MSENLFNVNTKEEFVDFIDYYEAHLKTLNKMKSELNLEKLVEKKKISEIAEYQKKIASLILDPKYSELIDMWYDKIEDPMLKRRLTLWKQNILRSKVKHNQEVRELTEELSDQIITHQYVLNGEDSDLGTIKDILRTSPDRELRKEAWLAKHAISETLEEPLKELMALRNELAQKEGFDSYVDMRLELDGLDKPQVKEFLTDLTDASQPIYDQILEDGKEELGIDKIKPWDIMYLLESVGKVDLTQFPKELISETLKKWAEKHGTNLDELGIEVVYTDIPYNGLCMTINDEEIKILTNPADGHGSFRTMFHEMGHALHSALNDQESIAFRFDSGIFNESMAEVFGYVARNPKWLEEMGLSEDEAIQIKKNLIAPWFHYLRERTAYALAEYKMYEDPINCDHDAILAEMEHEILGVSLDDTPRWAANTWYINFPVYWQGYVMADVVASQIHKQLATDHGSLHNSPEAFEEVCKIYLEPGASIDWQKKIKDHTGSELKTDALVEDLKYYLD